MRKYGIFGKALLNELHELKENRKKNQPYDEEKYEKLRKWWWKSQWRWIFSYIKKLYAIIVIITKKFIYPILIAVIGFLVGIYIWTYYHP